MYAPRWDAARERDDGRARVYDERDRADHDPRDGLMHDLVGNIELPAEQHPNAFLDRWVLCHHFFVRKVLLFKYSYAFVALPGGL
jgi:hypothetical protein